jgi:hypothetical protein
VVVNKCQGRCISGFSIISGLTGSISRSIGTTVSRTPEKMSDVRIRIAVWFVAFSFVLLLLVLGASLGPFGQFRQIPVFSGTLHLALDRIGRGDPSVLGPDRWKLLPGKIDPTMPGYLRRDRGMGQSEGFDRQWLDISEIPGSKPHLIYCVFYLFCYYNFILSINLIITF